MFATTHSVLDGDDQELYHPAIQVDEDKYVFWETKTYSEDDAYTFANGALTVIREQVLKSIIAANFYKLAKPTVADGLSDIGLTQ